MTLEKSDLNDILAKLPLFQELTPAQIQQLAAAVREKSLNKGEMLFQKGDPAKGFYLVLSGQIKLAFSSAQGNEKVVDILGPRQSFGEAVMFMNRPYPVFAEALSNAAVLHIPQSVVFELLEKDASFARSMLAGLSLRLHTLVNDVEAYSLRSGTERVIGYLLQNQGSSHNGPLEVELATSKQVIASRLNLTPETLSRVFHELSNAGLISVHGKRLVIPDVIKLSRYGQS